MPDLIQYNMYCDILLGESRRCLRFLRRGDARCQLLKPALKRASITDETARFPCISSYEFIVRTEETRTRVSRRNNRTDQKILAAGRRAIGAVHSWSFPPIEARNRR